MKFVFTKHAIDKFSVLGRLGSKITKLKIKETVKDPRWIGVSKHGQQTAMSLMDSRHIVRVSRLRYIGNTLEVE